MCSQAARVAAMLNALPDGDFERSPVAAAVAPALTWHTRPESGDRHDAQYDATTDISYHDRNSRCHRPRKRQYTPGDPLPALPGSAGSNLSQGSVLDLILSDEQTIIAFAESISMPPEVPMPMLARSKLP